MADISMCDNRLCTIKETCWRFKAPVNEFRQSYLVDQRQDKDGKCEMYWEFKEKIETHGK